MWPRFVGSTSKRKLAALEFEECAAEEPSTGTPKRRKSLDHNCTFPSFRKRPILAEVARRKSLNFTMPSSSPTSVVSTTESRTEKKTASRKPWPTLIRTNSEQTTPNAAPKTARRGNLRTANRLRRNPVIDDSFVLLSEAEPVKSEPKSSLSVTIKEEEDVQIESPLTSPRLQPDACMFSEADSVVDSVRQESKTHSIEQVSSSSANSRTSVFQPGRTVFSPPTPKRKARRKKLRGLAASIFEHLKSSRVQRYFRQVHADKGTQRVEIEKTASCWGVTVSTVARSHQQLFGPRSKVFPGSASSSRLLALPLARMLLTLLVFSSLFLIPSTFGIRCQCSTQKGAVPCYNNWCEVANKDGKEGACGLVQKNNQRTFACVRVAFGGGDECKVDRIDGQQQVRCWCRSADYCNVDMMDRIEDENILISAEEVVTAPSTRLQPTTPKDDFVIDTAYEDERLTGVDYDDEDFSIEDTFPHDHRLPPALPSTIPPVARKTSEGPTLPPWRRVVPAGDEDEEEPSSVPPPLPRTDQRQPVQRIEQTRQIQRTEQTRWEEERRRIAWLAAWREQERMRTSTTTPRSTTRTTESSTTRTTTTTTTSTTTTPRPTTTTTRQPSTTTRANTATTTTTTKPTSTAKSTTTTTNPADQLLKFKEHQNEAKMSYEKLKHRYRPVDLFATSSTASTTTTARLTSVLTSTRTTTPRTTTEVTTRRRTTTDLVPTSLVEEESPEGESLEEEPTAETPLFKVYKSREQGRGKKATTVASCLLALLLAIVF